jgi:Ni/Co efflux regulator RcnB
MRRLVVVLAAVFVAAGTMPAHAHHAFAAEFDAKKPVTFEKAVVTKVEWTNPHSWIHVDVPMPNGTKEAWAIEAGTPNVLFRRGFTKDALKPGMVIVIDGYRAKDGSHRANGRNLTLPNGQTLFLGSSGTGAPVS